MTKETKSKRKNILKNDEKIMASWAVGYILLILCVLVSDQQKIGVEELAAISLILLMASGIIRCYRIWKEKPVTISAQTLIDAEG